MKLKKLITALLLVNGFLGFLTYGMQRNDRDAGTFRPISTRNMYGQRSLKYLLVYLIKRWDCFKSLTDEQIIEKLESLPKELTDPFRLISMLEAHYTDSEKQVILACIMDEIDQLDKTIKSTKDYVMSKIISLGHDEILSFVQKHIDARARITIVFSNLAIEGFVPESIRSIFSGVLMEHQLNEFAASIPLLWFAISKQSLSMVKFLVLLGADIHETAGLSIFEWAIYVKNAKIIRFLLEQGANPNIHSHVSYYFLFDSRPGNDLEIAQLLLKHGADVNGGNGHLLNQAVSRGNLALTDLLLSWPTIQVDALDINQDTPLLNAISHCRYHLIDETQAENSHYDDRIRTVEKIVSSLLDHGANIDTQDNDGETALMCATSRGEPTLVKLLLEYGADASITNNDGHNALSIAHMVDHKQIIALLDAQQ